MLFSLFKTLIKILLFNNSKEVIQLTKLNHKYIPRCTQIFKEEFNTNTTPTHKLTGMMVVQIKLSLNKTRSDFLEKLTFT